MNARLSAIIILVGFLSSCPTPASNPTEMALATEVSVSLPAGATPSSLLASLNSLSSVPVSGVLSDGLDSEVVLNEVPLSAVLEAVASELGATLVYNVSSITLLGSAANDPAFGLSAPIPQFACQDTSALLTIVSLQSTPQMEGKPVYAREFGRVDPNPPTLSLTLQNTTALQVLDLIVEEIDGIYWEGLVSDGVVSLFIRSRVVTTAPSPPPS